jgi:signal transduction histidine kinase
VLNFEGILRLALLSVLIFQVLVIAFQISINKRKEAFYYLLYIVFVFLYNFRFLIPGAMTDHSNELILYMDKPLVPLIFWAYFRFARYFLDIPNLDHAFNKIAIVFEYSLISCVFLLVVLIHFFNEGTVLDVVFNFISISAGIVAILHLIYFVRIRKTTLNNFVLTGAFLILAGSTGSFILFEWQKLNPIFNTANLTLPHLFATFLELVIFNTGISLKSYILEKEKGETDRILIQKMQENEVISKELNSVKSSISADLHDDIGATFNSIDIYSSVSEKSLQSGDISKALECQREIRILTRDGISDMRDAIWLLRQNDKTNLGHLVQRWIDIAKPLMEAKGIDLRWNAALWPDHFIALNARRHLYFALKEVLNNVLKHSGSKVVDVTCFEKEGVSWIEIKDFGIGFDMNRSHLGDGLKNIQMRMQQIGGYFQIESIPGEGTITRIGI